MHIHTYIHDRAHCPERLVEADLPRRQESNSSDDKSLY